MIQNRPKGWGCISRQRQGAPSATPGRCRPVGPLAHSVQWTGRGIEPRSPGCKPGIFPLDEPPIFCQRSVWELNPVFRLTTAACSHSTYRPRVIPDGIEPSLSWLSPRRLRRWTTGSVVSDRGGSRTHRHEALYLIALPVCVPGHVSVAGPGVAPGVRSV